MATLNAMMDSIITRLPLPPGPPSHDIDIRLDVMVEGDVTVSSWSSSEGGKEYRDTRMQVEIRRWAGVLFERKGIYKPDSMVVLTISPLSSPRGIRKVVTLIGEGKVDLVNADGIAVKSSNSEFTQMTMLREGRDARARAGKKWSVGTAKAIIYLNSSHEVWGCGLGVTVVGSRFARLCHLGQEGVIALECGEAFLARLGEDERNPLASDFLEDLTNVDHLPYDLTDTPGSGIDHASLATLEQTYRAAIKILLNLSVSELGPIPNSIPPPSANSRIMASILARANRHDFSESRERFEVAGKCRRDLCWRAEPGSGGKRKRSGDADKDGGAGGGKGKGKATAPIRGLPRRSERVQGATRGAGGGSGSGSGRAEGRDELPSPENGESSRAGC